MRIRSLLVLCYSLSTKSLAGSVRVRNICKSFAEMGVQVTIMTAEAEPDTSGRMPGCRILHYPDLWRSSPWRRLFSRLLGLPDPLAFWARRLLDRSREQLRYGAFDAVLVSSPPHSIMAAGIEVSRLLGIPFFADFRDGLVDNHRFRWLTPVHKWAGRRLEHAIVESASLIVTNTETLRRSLILRYPEAIDRFQTIPNGFEALQVDPRRFGKPTVAYIGSAYAGFAVRFMAGLARSLQDSLGDRVAVVTAGPDDWSLSTKFYNWEHQGFVSNADATALMAGADVVVLLMPPGESEPSPTVPLKTYQYLASGAYVVYIGEFGETSSLLGRFPGTACFRRGEAVQALALIAKLLEGSLARYDRPGLAEYQFSALAKRMLDAMEMDGGEVDA